MNPVVLFIGCFFCVSMTLLTHNNIFAIPAIILFFLGIASMM